jgi:hypothetical protein
MIRSKPEFRDDGFEVYRLKSPRELKSESRRAVETGLIYVLVAMGAGIAGFVLTMIFQGTLAPFLADLFFVP